LGRRVRHGWFAKRHGLYSRRSRRQGFANVVEVVKPAVISVRAKHFTDAAELIVVA
jgi:hypothetical protein